MRVVYKHELEFVASGLSVELRLPRNTEILSVQAQGGKLQLWALQDPDERAETIRRFRIFLTGETFDQRRGGIYTFCGTVQLDPDFVLHVFEVEL